MVSKEQKRRFNAGVRSWLQRTLHIDKPYQTIRVQTWTAAKSIFSAHGTDWIFRGQSNSEWNLATAFEREVTPRAELLVRRNKMYQSSDVSYSLLRTEDVLLKAFKRAAHLYLKDADLPSHTLDWLALMQHFGVPTRLLDFTVSPYVASFFAFAKRDNTEYRSLWMFNASAVNYFTGFLSTRDVIRRAAFIKSIRSSDNTLSWSLELMQSRLGIDRITSRSSLMSRLADAPYFDAYLAASNNSQRMVLPMRGFTSNERMLVQQGLFIMPTDLSVDFMSNFRAMQAKLLDLDYTPSMFQRMKEVTRSEPLLYKILIPGKLRAEVLDDLYRMNISYASLFPGLEGYARSLSERLFLEADPAVMEIRDQVWSPYIDDMDDANS
jgi:FRG domain